MKGKVVVFQAKADLWLIWTQWLEVVVDWPVIVPRLVCYGPGDHKAIAQAQYKIRGEFMNFLEEDL